MKMLAAAGVCVRVRACVDAPFVREWSATGLNNPSVNLNHFPPERRVFVRPNTHSSHTPDKGR